MEQPMFYQGQRVVALTVVANGWSLNPNSPQPIDGKSYYVSNPKASEFGGLVWITISGFSDKNEFWQGQFVPYDTDAQLEEEIHQAMKGNLIEN